MDKIRDGNFTSSEAYRLMSNGKTKGSIGVPFYSYVEEKNMERRLNRTLGHEIDATAASWGKLCEPYAFKLLPIDYTSGFDTTLSHPTIDYWKGTPDVTKPETVGDIKCPHTLKSFCQLLDPFHGKDVQFDGMTIEAVRENHKDGEKFFWQIVSNACITGATKGELIVFAPYLEELDKIKRIMDGDPKFYKLQFASDDQMPYLIAGGHYKNLNVISFDILKRDKDALTERVLKAGELLIPRP
jgi:hypothetical protein